jgi:hypothetical protein
VQLVIIIMKLRIRLKQQKYYQINNIFTKERKKKKTNINVTKTMFFVVIAAITFFRKKRFIAKQVKRKTRTT